MALGRNPLADRVAAYAGSDLDDAADEFMADHQPGLDRALAPLVPQVDVQVGAADGGFLELDQDLVRARLRDRDLLHPDALGRFALDQRLHGRGNRSEEHTSELQSLMRISYAVFCLKKKKKTSTAETYGYSR